jgi:hypothetical protein
MVTTPEQPVLTDVRVRTGDVDVLNVAHPFVTDHAYVKPGAVLVISTLEALSAKTLPPILEAGARVNVPDTKGAMDANVVSVGIAVGVAVGVLATVVVVVVVVVAEAEPDHTASYEAMNRETKPTKARETTQRFEIAEPSIGILLEVSFCKILLITCSQTNSRDQFIYARPRGHSLKHKAQAHRSPKTYVPYRHGCIRPLLLQTAPSQGTPLQKRQSR